MNFDSELWVISSDMTAKELVNFLKMTPEHSFSKGEVTQHAVPQKHPKTFLIYKCKKVFEISNMTFELQIRELIKLHDSFPVLKNNMTFEIHCYNYNFLESGWCFTTEVLELLVSRKIRLNFVLKCK